MSRMESRNVITNISGAGRAVVSTDIELDKERS